MGKTLYVTTEHGDVIDIIENDKAYAILDYGDRILRKKAIEYLQDTKEIKYHFIKVNSELFSQYCKKYPILSTLICHISYMDNIVSYENGKIVRIKDLPSLCEVSETTIKKQIKGLIQDDIVHKVPYKKKQKCLMINPFLAIRGKRIYSTTYKEFELSELRKYIKEVK